jgi:hypothetical protein
MSVSDGLFVMFFISAIGSIIAAWWQFASANPTLTSSREVNTFIGLLANSIVLVFPVVYAFSLPLQRVVPWEYVLFGSWGLSALTIVVSSFGLKKARFPLILGALSIVVFLMMIPPGVL